MIFSGAVRGFATENPVTTLHRPASKRRTGARRLVDDSDQLLRRCQQGDESALSELVRSYQDRIYGLALRVLNDAALAEEATAHALFKIWNNARQWQGKSSAGTWIYRLAVRTILDVQRGQRRWWRRWAVRWSGTVADRRPGPAEQFAHDDRRTAQEKQVRDALQQLPEVDRALVHLHYFEGRSLAEIEPILNASRAALKMRLARARQKLRAILESPDGVA